MNNKTFTFRKDNICIGQMGTERPWELHKLPIPWTLPPPPPYSLRERRLCSSRKTSWDWLGKQRNKKVNKGALSLKTRELQPSVVDKIEYSTTETKYRKLPPYSD